MQDTLWAAPDNPAPTRRMIYIARTHAEQLQAELTARGWLLMLATTLRDVQREMAKKTATVCLFDFSDYTVAQLTEFEAVFVDSRIGWTAMISPPALAVPEINRLIRLFFFDFVTLPSSARRIVDIVGHAHGMVTLQAGDTGSIAGEYPNIIGQCPAMRTMFKQMRRFTGTDAPILIYGESGTGKELSAQAIHEHSMRRKGPFVALNCGAIPRELVQSVLFGHERGAFTGATHQKIGHVEAADGGTLFLDEIGDLPLDSQVSLLRFLQERKIQRLGSHLDTPVDVRIISATHMDLEHAATSGAFRLDLYHRLCVLRLALPPLRERGQDIETLAQHTLNMYRGDSSRRIHGFSTQAITAMRRYRWPGNIRQLINHVRRAIVMAEGRVISAADLELDDIETAPVPTLSDARDAADRQALEKALLRYDYRLGEVAHALGISRATLYRLMQAHAMDVSATNSDAL